MTTTDVHAAYMGEIDELIKELVLALQLLDRYLPAAPCLLVTADNPARRRILGNPDADEVLPIGSCLAHWQYDGEPCRVGLGMEMLASHGIRGGV